MADENTDGQLAFIKELADIKQLKKEVKSLKTQLGKLSSSIEQVEVMDFQNQLNSLSERIGNFSSDIIEIKRLIFRQKLNIFRLVTENILHQTGHVPPFPPGWQQAEQNCFSEINGYYLKNDERIKHYENVNEFEKVIDDFIINVNTALQRYGYKEGIKRID